MSFPLCWWRGRNWLGKLCSEKKREEEKRGRKKRFLCLFLFLSLSLPSTTSSSNTSRNSSSCSLAPPATTRGGGGLLFVPLSIDPARPADGSRRQQDASAPGEERPTGSFRIPPARASSDRCAKPSTFPPFWPFASLWGFLSRFKGEERSGSERSSRTAVEAHLEKANHGVIY